MLEESICPKEQEKRVWLSLQQPELKAFLAAILREWRYLPCDEYVEDGLLLAEEGALDPPPNQQTIWLSSSAYASQGRLQFPLDLTDLYALLERRYHNPPRRHLRLAIDLPCTLVIDGCRESAKLLSLSDRGCRLNFDTELVRDMPLILQFDLGGEPVSIAGKVIYCVTRYSTDNPLYYDLGLLFAELGRRGQAELLDYIVASYFRRVKDQLPEGTFSTALRCFSLNSGVRSYLDTASCG